MKTNLRRENGGFTLIELMAVITIIVILAGLVVGGMGFVNERQAKEKAKVQIALLSKALEEYKLEMGSYPQIGTIVDTPEAGTGQTKQLYEALFKAGYDYTNPDTPPTNWENKAKTIFLPELDPRTTKQGWVTTTKNAAPPAGLLDITDPWGNEYRYRKGANAVNPDFDLWSMGKDGLTDTNNPSTSEPNNRDDIRNF